MCTSSLGGFPGPRTSLRSTAMQQRRYCTQYPSFQTHEPVQQRTSGTPTLRSQFMGAHASTGRGRRGGYPVVSVLPSVTKKSKEMEDNSPLKNDQKDVSLICKLIGEGKFVTVLALLHSERTR